MSYGTVDGATVTLENRHGRCEVALYGAFVAHYVPAGGTEVVAEPVPFFSQTKLSNLVGGIPLCWPWFVNQGPAGVPPNGLTRYQKWRVKERTDGDGLSSLVLETDDDAWTRSVWPHRYHAELLFALGERLSAVFRVTNVGETTMSCNDGFHSYFRVGEAHRCTVKGTDGLNYFYRPESAFGFDRRWTGDFAVGEMACGYAFRSGPHAFEIVDPTLKRRIEVAYAGNEKSCIWNPGTQNPAFADSWRGFLCVEGANLYADGSYALAPGESHELSLSIRAVSADKIEET